MIMLETKLHHQPWWPSWIIDGFKRCNFGRGLFGPNLVSLHPVVLNNIFLKDFHIFNKSEMMAAILDLGQGHRTQFWKKIQTPNGITSKLGAIWPSGS